MKANLTKRALSNPIDVQKLAKKFLNGYHTIIVLGVDLFGSYLEGIEASQWREFLLILLNLVSYIYAICFFSPHIMVN